MFTDQYMKRRAAQSSSSPKGPQNEHLNSRIIVSYGATNLGCKSKISLSRTQSQPAKLRSQSSPKRSPNSKTTSSSRPRQRLVGCQSHHCQQSVLSQQNEHSMPSVLKSHKPPVVYSPRHSPSMPRSRAKPKTSTTLPSVQYRESYDFRRSLEKNLNSLSRPRSRQSSTDSVLSRQISVASSQSSGISGGMERVSLESSYSYVYDSVKGPKRRLSGGGLNQSSSDGGVKVSSSHSSGVGRTESWRKLALTVCMGEGVMLEDEDSCSSDHSGLDSVGDSEIYRDGYSQGADLDDDDLTDLDSDNEDQSHDSRLCSALSSSDPVTLVGREMSRDRVTAGDSGVSSVRSVGGEGVRMRYHNDQLVAEIERRRERDFGSHRDPVESMMSSDKQFRVSLPARFLPPKNRSATISKGEGQKSFGEATPTALIGSEVKERHAESVGVVPSSPLTPSLFPEHLPPTIHFPLRGEAYSPLPREQRALLRWKVVPITPNLVRQCVARAGFTKCTRGTLWLGYWGKQLTPEAYKTVKEYQKVNHFPGTFSIGRKDCLWRNLSRLQARVGKKELNFVPKTYILPQDLKLLKRDWDASGAKPKWILKPPAAARGIGIRVVSKWNQIPMKRPVVVQKYLADPYLINGSKFDLRVYVYVSCYDPLHIYVFKEGLARFATCKYSSAMKHLSNRYMHLTNYSINKRNSEFTPNTDETVCQGHKWGLLALWRYMRTELGVDTDSVWHSITDLVIKTIICSEPEVASKTKANVRTSYSVHELFGFDVMLDKQLKPWILEVNVSPSLHSNSPLDVNIKGVLVRDLLNIAGFTLPTAEQLSGEQAPPRYHLAPEERAKHSNFVQKTTHIQADREKILDSLTQDDLLVIMQSEDELSRHGEFERVFPCAEYDNYRKFFPTEKYYNILLGEWTARFHKNPAKGIALLRKQSKLLATRTN